ncbi:MAG: deoxyribodipyrimidine photo-lyase [Verrucomicrobiae bacterium]|nr:deoxyribodipyrimidine photo-lyase [Verrucomicrobiae bacterium]
MSATYRTAIHWFRRDLRLSDNTALWHAAQSAESVVPVYVLSNWTGEHHWTGPGRQQFLCGCLDSLAKNLETIGARLIIRQGDAADQLEQLIKDSQADAVFFNRDPDPYGREMEKQVQERCRSLGIDFHSHKDAVLHEPGEVLTGSGDPYKVYTPYSKNWFDQPKSETLGRPRSLHTPDGIKSDALPSLATWNLSIDRDLDSIQPGERAARDRLKKALDGPLLHYADKRNDPSAESTSRLGPDLRFGTISVREVFHRARKAADEAGSAGKRKSLHTFQKQLAWREFFMAILGHFPHVLDEEFNPAWRGLPWDDPGKQDRFERWKTGRTGFPIVDAGMRQLLATGYLHNRVRMIVAMFLTKDLHLHWRLGESHFMRHLIDGEIANNNGGWQWSAGTGADAAPYFRIQNPWTQTERYDPRGDYIKRWVPELEKVDSKRFQKPPEDSNPIADDYVIPVVDHKTERERTLEIFKKHRVES